MLLEAALVPSFGHSWHWILGGGGGYAAGEIVRGFFRHKQKHDRAKVREALERAGGKSGVGLIDFQVAEQLGWDQAKARAALKRLEKKGEVREYEGQWYLTGVVQTSSSPWSRRR